MGYCIPIWDFVGRIWRSIRACDQLFQSKSLSTLSISEARMRVEQRDGNDSGEMGQTSYNSLMSCENHLVFHPPAEVYNSDNIDFFRAYPLRHSLRVGLFLN